MTVANNYAPIRQLGNGVTTAFSGSWSMINPANAVVQLESVSTGVRVPVTQGSGSNQYQIAITSSGFTVTFNTAPTSSYYVDISRATIPQQTNSYTTSTGFQGQVEENSFDALTAMVQDCEYNLGQAISIPVGESYTTLLPSAANRANYVLCFDASGNVTVSTQSIATIQAGSVAAAASASAAASSATSAASSATSAATSATNAGTSATNAANSATAAANAAASVLWNRIQFLTYANSPYTVLTTDEGTLFSVNSSGGNVVINLPSIAAQTLPFNIGVKKESTDGNTITVNPNGTDTIDGNASAIISTPASGTTFVAENTTTPKQWISSSFGASAGNMVPNTFSGNGSTTAFTLTQSPGSANNVWVYISGVRQVPTTDYTVSGTTITFTSAPPTGTNNIFCLSGTTISIGTPAAGTVGSSQMSSSGAIPTGWTVTAPAAGNTSAQPAAMSNFTQGANGSSMVLLGTAVASASSSVSITNIPAGYDQYELRYSNIIPSVSGANLYLSQSSNNGTTWLTSSWQGEAYYTNSSNLAGYIANPASVGLQISSNTSNNANQGATGRCLMSSLGSSSLYKMMYFETSWGIQMSFGGGFYNGDTNAVNALQIVPSSGTMTGKFALYGIRNS